MSTLVVAFSGPAKGEEDVPSEDRKPIVLTDRARELHSHSLVIDGHNDMPWEIRKQGGIELREDGYLAAAADVANGYPASCEPAAWALSSGRSGYLSNSATRAKRLATTLEQIELVKQMIARYPETFELALTVDDIERIHGEGKIASLIGVEGGHCIEESLRRAAKSCTAWARAT